jgi:hypothetical protein
MDRTNHYEVAFEAYLQRCGLCYVAVDETRRAFMGETSLKSLDFIVFGAESRLVVDVKGRRFPAGPPRKPRRVWECWSEREDIEGLGRWASLAGPDYRGLLVFTYHVHASVALPDNTEDLWTFRGRRYLFRAVAVEDYQRYMRVRSPSWRTVTLPKAKYRSLVRPFNHFTGVTARPIEDPFADGDQFPRPCPEAAWPSEEAVEEECPF